MSLDPSSLDPSSLALVSDLPLMVGTEPPNSKRIVSIAIARSNNAAEVICDQLLNPKVRQDIIANCADKAYTTIKVCGEGILPMTVAAQMQARLECPVYVCAYISPQRTPEKPCYRGVVLLVPRPDLAAKYKATGGHFRLPAPPSLQDMDGWDFFVENRPTDFGTHFEAFVASHTAAKYLTIGGAIPKTGNLIYACPDLDFPVPVLVNEDNAELGQYVGIMSTASLGLETDPSRPADEGPSLLDEPYDHGVWLVQCDNWKATVAKAMVELSQTRTDIVDVFFYEASPGSWTGAPYTDAQTMLDRYYQQHPHPALSIEAEAWANWIAIQRLNDTWTGKVTVKLGETQDDRVVMYERMGALAEVIKNSGYTITWLVNQDDLTKLDIEFTEHTP